MEGPIDTKFPPDYLSFLQANPDEQVDAILRCSYVDAALCQEVEDAGMVVTRQFRLITGMAVQGRACDLVALADASWVLRVEPDQPVHTMHT